MSKTAAEVFLFMCNNQGNVPPGLNKQKRTRCNMIFGFFQAMASESEQQILEDPAADEGKRERLVVLLEHLVRERFAQAFKDSKKREVPPSCRAGKRLSTSSIESRNTELSNLKAPEVTPDEADFAKFRAALPVQEAFLAGGGGP